MSAAVTPIRPAARGKAREWIAPDQVREFAPGLTKEKLQYLRDQGKGPRYYKPTERTVLYDRADIDAWIESGLVTTRAQS